jgi:hypothetical protein
MGSSTNGRIRGRWAYPIATVLALGMTAGCENGPPAASQVTGLHFVAITSLPSNPPPPVDITLTDADAGRARSIYQLTLALPETPAGTYNCPADLGVRYRLDFLSGPSIAVTVTANPNGCHEVTIPGTSQRRAITDDYWAALAENLGVAEAAIYPYSPR